MTSSYHLYFNYIQSFTIKVTKCMREGSPDRLLVLFYEEPSTPSTHLICATFNYVLDPLCLLCLLLSFFLCRSMNVVLFFPLRIVPGSWLGGSRQLVYTQSSTISTQLRAVAGTCHRALSSANDSGACSEGVAAEAFGRVSVGWEVSNFRKARPQRLINQYCGMQTYSVPKYVYPAQ